MDETALYYYDQPNQRARGPFSLSQFEEFAQTGVVAVDTLIAPVGTDRWIAIADWPELRELLFPEAHLHLKAEGYQPAPEAEATLETDAYAVLAINRSREDPDKLIITDEDMRPKMSRRTRDFLWGFFGGNALLLVGAGLYTLLFGVNVVFLLYALGFLVIWSIGITWISFGVMSRW